MLYTCVFSCNLPPALLAEWLGSVTYHCGNWGVGGSWRWQFSRHSCWDSNLRPFICESVTLPLSHSQPLLYQYWRLSLVMESHTHLCSGPAQFTKPHEVKTLLLAENILSWKSCCWLILYSTILRSRADSLHLHVILHEWLAFYSMFLNIHRSGVLTALTWLVPYETAAILARSVYVIQPCTMSLHAKPHT